MNTKNALPTSSFALATCQVGAEAALKAEVQRELPSLRPAFMRPGFVTFKSDEALSPASPTFARALVFARVLAASFGKASNDDVVARVTDLARAHGPAHLHVWMRDVHSPADAPRVDVDLQAPAIALATRLHEATAQDAAQWLTGAPMDGDVVIDVVGVDDGVWYLGLHVHGPTTSPFPGADPRLEIPAEAPSRAWAKIEQGLRLGNVPLRAGDRVVEVGASPGGVTHALLARGCNVIAVDPGEMDKRVLASPRLRHVRVPIAEVDPSSLPKPVRFIVLDVNISPFAALRQIEGLVAAHASDLCGLLLTLKLGDWHMAQRVPHLLSIVKKLAPPASPIVELHAKQLPASKVEIFVAALTMQGVKRRALARARPR